MSLHDTPRANRLHIGIYGKRNAGKSSLINALTGQDVALVSPEAGTTTDPVFKSMELHPVGPVVFIDTAGFDDEGGLGALRVERTEAALDKTDIAIMVVDGAALAAGTDAAVQSAGLPDDGMRHEKRWTEATPAEEKRRLEATLAEEKRRLEATLAEEKRWIEALEAKGVPVIVAVNKLDVFAEKAAAEDCDGRGSATSDDPWLHKADENRPASGMPRNCAHGCTVASRFLAGIVEILGNHPIIAVSAAKKLGLGKLRSAIRDSAPEDFLRRKILGDMIEEGSLVLLVTPQDIQAPKGRLILPQVQTLRELLDRHCTAVSTTADGLERTLGALSRAPDLIITDSQCFSAVCEKKPAESALTSFSVLFAAYKGDVQKFVEGASSLDDMTENSRVLIAEACTHAPLSEDIGRVKIPNLLRKKFGSSLEIVNVCGNDFPAQDELKKFDLIIHCGACMFNRRHVMNRIAAAEAAGVPITNYGVALAKLAGILEKITLP